MAFFMNLQLLNLGYLFGPLGHNFSLQYQKSTWQTTEENKEKYQLDNQLTQYQILQTNNITIVRQTVRRIANEILGVKGLTTLWIFSPLWLNRNRS